MNCTGEVDSFGELDILLLPYKCTLELMYINRVKSLNYVFSMLHFRQCIWGCLHENLGIFHPFGRGALQGNTPRLVERW